MKELKDEGLNDEMNVCILHHKVTEEICHDHDSDLS